MPKVMNWLKTHPAFIGPALTLVAIAAVLYLFIYSYHCPIPRGYCTRRRPRRIF